MIFAIGTFSSKVLVFLLMPLYTAVLTEAQYGTVDLMVQVGNFLLPLVSCGIVNGIIRFGLDKHYRKTDVFTTGFLTILTGFCILLLLEPILVHVPYLNENTMMIYIFVLMSSMRSLCSQFVRAKGYVKLYALDGILSTATTIFFNVLYLVVLKWGINGYMLAMISADTISSLFLFYIANLGHYINVRKLDVSTAKEMLRYSIPLIPNSIFWWINNMASRFLIAAFMDDTSANGLFAVAYKIPTIIVLMSNIFMDAWQMSAVTDESNKRAQFFTRVFLCYQSLICTAASGLILFSKVVTKILVTDAFYPSWKYIPLLLLSTIFSCMSTFLGSVYMVEKKSMLNFITTGIGAAINVLLNLVMIPIFGVNGAAFATFLSYLIVFVLRMIDTRRFMPMRFNGGRLVFNTVLLLAQSFIMIFEVKGWIFFELILTALMVTANMSALWATVRQVLFKRRRTA